MLVQSHHIYIFIVDLHICKLILIKIFDILGIK